ncbi:MAG: Gfo/Idh/MocA family oxidoreductase [Planctomycetota bacterium]
MSELRVAVAGLGYWGPVIARNFASHPRTCLTALVDLRKERIEAAQQNLKNVPGFTDLDDALPHCDVVALSTPVSTHFELAMKALKAGKHLFIEKPITRTSEEAEILVKEAQKRGLVIVVDHILLFQGMVRKVKEIIASGELGDINFFYSVRANLGLFQTDDINVIWDLAPHDLSMMLYFLGEPASCLQPAGEAHLPAGLIDDIHMHYRYPKNLVATIYLSWLSPFRQRMTVIGGSKKTVAFSDLWQGEEIRVYDRHVTSELVDGTWRYSYHRGGIVIPEISRHEPLKLEIDEFAAAILDGKPMTSDGNFGLQIVRLLEKCDQSLRHPNGGH